MPRASTAVLDGALPICPRRVLRGKQLELFSLGNKSRTLNEGVVG
ncbi:MAG: hypothetical protein WBV06_00765 [Acidimicrobiia bacterium]